MTNSRGVRWFFFVMGMLFLTAVVARLFQPSDGLKLALLAWQQLLFVLGGVFGSSRRYFQPIKVKAAVKALACGFGIYVLNILVGALVFVAAAHFLGKDAVQELMRGDRAGVEMLVRNTQPHIAYGAVILLLIGAPLGEELFFRGLLVDLLRDRVGTIRAVFLGALLFALLHFYTLQFVPVLISGVILGLLFVRAKNIFFPVIAHATVNTLALAALLMSS